MGDPRKIRRKFTRPGHPWNRERIEIERKIVREYGLKNKTELYVFNTKLRDFTGQAKKLIAATGTQADLEKKQLLGRLARLGLLSQESGLDNVLSLTVKNILDRRLQTVLLKKQLARTTSQARQLIVHGHVKIGAKKITAPSYLVRTSDEHSIGFLARSPFAKADHPERTLILAVKSHQVAEMPHQVVENKDHKEHKEAPKDHKEHKEAAKDHKAPAAAVAKDHKESKETKAKTAPKAAAKEAPKEAHK